MPRPGPRPYECVRRAWHSDRHQPMRASLIQELFRMANQVHSQATRKNQEWQEKLPSVVLKAEEIIYSKANSEAEYMDLKTLWDRANDAIDTIIRKDESTESGDLLLPCIEAALILGCIQRRASRSQRYSNPGCYLTPLSGAKDAARQINNSNKAPVVGSSSFRPPPSHDPSNNNYINKQCSSSSSSWYPASATIVKPCYSNANPILPPGSTSSVMNANANANAVASSSMPIPPHFSPLGQGFSSAYPPLYYHTSMENSVRIQQQQQMMLSFQNSNPNERDVCTITKGGLFLPPTNIFSTNKGGRADLAQQMFHGGKQPLGIDSCSKNISGGNKECDLSLRLGINFNINILPPATNWFGGVAAAAAAAADSATACCSDDDDGDDEIEDAGSTCSFDDHNLCKSSL